MAFRGCFTYGQFNGVCQFRNELKIAFGDQIIRLAIFQPIDLPAPYRAAISVIFMNEPKIHSEICSINNLAPHYRYAMFALMDKELKCDFYIGDRIATPILPMNVDALKGYRKTLTFIPLPGNFYWQKGAVRIAFDSYKYYLVDGEPYCLSNWLILLITKLLRKKTWLWSHGWYGDENLLKKVVKKIFFHLSDKVLLYGDYARNLMIAQGFDAYKLVCIYNSMDYDKQVKIRASLSDAAIYTTHFNNDDPVLIYIGRIKKSKIPIIIAINKIDLQKPSPAFIQRIEENASHVISLSSVDARNRDLSIEALKSNLFELAPDDFVANPSLIGDLLPPGGLALLVVPIDLQAQDP